MNYHFANQTSFNSKIARRIFSMFVFCALIPLLAISAVSFFFVSSQLKDQAYERLRQQCKSKGLQIFEHLTILEDQIAMAAGEYVQHDVMHLDMRPYDAHNREGSGFKHIFLLKPDGTKISIFDHDGNLDPTVFESLMNSDKNQILISLRNDEDCFPGLFIKRLLDPAQPGQGYIVGEVDPLYLFSIGTEGALPPEVDMEVRQLDGEVLISSIFDNEMDKNFNEIITQRALTGKHTYTFNGKQNIYSYWSLFLRHRFGHPDWVIIFSQTKASILSPFYKFSYIYVLLILLTFFSIILLSIRTIEKRTIPIETLKKGAMRIAKGEFGHPVTITSGDEFEELSKTFNEMSDKLKQGQAMLLQAAKMSTFGQMGAGIVHEIGQPLTAISGYAELMRMGLSPDKHQYYSETICSETQRLAKIIAKFRNFSRSSQEVFTQLNLNEILDNTRDLLDHNLKMKSVQLEFAKNEKLPVVSGDKDGLQQVFLNLMVNAIDALEEKPKGERSIWVKSYADIEMVRIEISDNGCGIAPQIQQSIFDPFFTTKSEDKGTGLGLSIISSIIHKHEGKITLESAVDMGTRFIISLPVSRCGQNIG